MMRLDKKRNRITYRIIAMVLLVVFLLTPFTLIGSMQSEAKLDANTSSAMDIYNADFKDGKKSVDKQTALVGCIKAILNNKSGQDLAPSYGAIYQKAVRWLEGLQAPATTNGVRTDTSHFLVPGATEWIAKKLKMKTDKWSTQAFTKYASPYKNVFKQSWMKKRVKSSSKVTWADVAKACANRAWACGARGTGLIDYITCIEHTKYSKYKKKAKDEKKGLQGIVDWFYELGRSWKYAQNSTASDKIDTQTDKAQLEDHKGGLLKSKDLIYRHMDNFPSSFKTASGKTIDYVDVCVPYKTKLRSGISDQFTPNHTAGSANSVNVENQLLPDDWKPKGGLASRKISIKKAVKTAGATYYFAKNAKGDKGGKLGLQVWEGPAGAGNARFVMTAVQSFFFSKNKPAPGDPTGGLGFKHATKKSAWSGSIDGHSTNNGGELGEVIDVIFTDGFVVHAIFIDENADGDTNSTVKSGVSSAYKHIAGKGAGHHLELVGTPSTAGKRANDMFRKYYMEGTNKKRKIMYYRMYDVNAADNPHPTSAEAASLGYKPSAQMTSLDLSGEASDQNGGAASGSSLGSKSKIDEGRFASIQYMNEAVVDLANLTDLSPTQLRNLELWKNDITESATDNILIKGGRLIAMWVGIFLIVWCMLMYMAFWFDTVNTLVDIELLPIISFGRLRKAEAKEEATWNVRDLAKSEQKSITHTYLFIIMCIGIAMGIAIISGMLFDLIWNIVKWVMKIFIH